MDEEDPGQVFEGDRPFDPIILMRSPGRSPPVAIIAVKDQARLLGGLLHEPVARLVVKQGLKGIGRLRGRIFGMGVVQVDAASVGGHDVGDVQPGVVGQQAGMGPAPEDVKTAGVLGRMLRGVIPGDGKGTGTTTAGGVHQPSGEEDWVRDRIRG